MATLNPAILLSSILVSLTGQVSKIVPDVKVERSVDISNVIMLVKNNDQSSSKPTIPSPRRGEGRREAAKHKT